MNIPIDPAPPESREAAFAAQRESRDALPFERPHFGADDPPWDAAMAIFVWLSSVALIAVVPAVTALVYAFGRYGVLSREEVTRLALAPEGIVVQVVATLPAHLLTLGVVWLVVTGAGRRPFLPLIGLTRSGALPQPLWTLVWTACGVGLWFASWILTVVTVALVGAEKTAFERLIESSMEARFALAALAVVSAPLVEEVVYRGVVYPAFRRAFGVGHAIMGVAALFAVVHVPQYWNNPGLIVGLAFLSVALTIVRARTGSIFPCFVIHLVFNSISAVLLLLEPTLRQFEPKVPPTTSGAEGSLVWLITTLLS